MMLALCQELTCVVDDHPLTVADDSAWPHGGAGERRSATGFDWIAVQAVDAKPNVSGHAVPAPHQATIVRASTFVHVTTCWSEMYSSAACAWMMLPGPYSTVGMPAWRVNSRRSVPQGTPNSDAAMIPLGSGGANEIGEKWSYPGSYTVRPATLRAVYMDLATSLGEQGFRWIFVVNSHGSPNHNVVLDQAGDYFRDTFGGHMSPAASTAHVWP